MGQLQGQRVPVISFPCIKMNSCKEQLEEMAGGKKKPICETSPRFTQNKIFQVTGNRNNLSTAFERKLDFGVTNSIQIEQ